MDERRQDVIGDIVYALMRIPIERSRMTSKIEARILILIFVRKIKGIGSGLKNVFIEEEKTSQGVSILAQVVIELLKDMGSYNIDITMIRGLMKSLSDIEYAYGVEMLSAAIEKKLPGIMCDDVRACIQKCKDIKDFYLLRPLGAVLINGMDVDQQGNGTFPGIEGLDEHDIEDLISTCLAQKDYETAGYLEITRYSNYWYTEEEVLNTVQDCLNKAAKRLSNQDVYKADLLNERGNPSEEAKEYKKAYDLLVYAIENIEDISHADVERVISGLHNPGIEPKVLASYTHIARIAFMKHHPEEAKKTPELHRDLRDWLQASLHHYMEYSGMLTAAAAVDARIADKLDCLEWLEEPIDESARLLLVIACMKNPDSTGIDAEKERLWIRQLKLNDIDRFAAVALKPGDAGIKVINEEDVENWLASCEKYGRIDKAISILLAAIKSERLKLQAGQIIRWGEKALKQQPIKAMELGLAAKDAGIDVPEEIIRQWQVKCFEGKTPEETANNIIDLIVVYQNRSFVKRMPPDERRLLDSEIDAAFDKVMQQKDETGITATIPLAEVMEKIHRILL
jgi:hypothetical protein